MENILKHSPETVRTEISATQDGGQLVKSDRFTDFINECINCNTSGYYGSKDNPPTVNTVDLIMDFDYMIDQLTRAKEALNNLIND